MEYNEEESKRTEQAYLSPEIVLQRKRILEKLKPVRGERIVDVGSGPGLLAAELADQVGDDGRIVAADSSSAMMRLAESRCSALTNVEFVKCDATDLAIDDANADAVTCTQLLLYVSDVSKAINEIFRILKPGGRVVIMETDWRSTVLHSNDEAKAEKIIECWDRAVPSPRLPARLRGLLRMAGFTSVKIDAIPIISTSAALGEFSMSMMLQCVESACEQGVISESEGQEWLAELTELGVADEYFFCVNRFLFSAIKG
jgi:arsenite methyltransferase